MLVGLERGSQPNRYNGVAGEMVAGYRFVSLKSAWVAYHDSQLNKRGSV